MLFWKFSIAKSDTSEKIKCLLIHVIVGISSLVMFFNIFRKVVIGFAFMVPDTKYNEAYISFIFTHPEWREAGIATFMLYHLIQVGTSYFKGCGSSC